MRDRRYPVTILTGFLGSGKTTILKSVLKDPVFSHTVVIINEFGEVGLDHLLVEKSDEGIVQMNSGCICCTMRDDILEIFEDLVSRRERGLISRFDRIVIETSGLADPAPILHTVMSDNFASHYFRIDGVITTVDTVLGQDTLGKYTESAKQVAIADRLILTKTDIAEASTIVQLEAQLKAINPAARIERVVNGAAKPEQLFESGPYDSATRAADINRWLQDEAFGHGEKNDHALTEPVEEHHEHDHDHTKGIRSFCITRDEPIEPEAFSAFLDLLNVSGFAEKLLRMKGIISLAGEAVDPRPLVIHAVQHIKHSPVELAKWPDDDHRTRMVFVTRDLAEEKVRNIWDSLVDKWETASDMDYLHEFED